MFKLAINEDEIIKQSNNVCKLGNIAKNLQIEEEIEYYHLKMLSEMETFSIHMT